jgi:septum formation topological specificity factor MinE
LLVVSGLDWRWLRRLRASLLRVIYRNMQVQASNINVMHGVQKVVYYMLMHDLTILALQAIY